MLNNFIRPADRSTRLVFFFFSHFFVRFTPGRRTLDGRSRLVLIIVRQYEFIIFDRFPPSAVCRSKPYYQCYYFLNIFFFFSSFF